jgi:hypothetical protein
MGASSDIYAKSYGNTVALLAQQKASRLRNCVTVKSGVVGEETYMDQIEKFSAGTRTVQTDNLAATSPSVLTFQRRKVGLTDYYIAKGIDKMDDLRTLADPTSAAVQSSVAAMGRAIDSAIITALGGTAYTGKVGGTSVALPTAQKIAVSTTGLTLAKWLDGVEILNSNDFDPSDERYLVIGSSQLNDLLNTTQITSQDYSAVKALVQGQIDTFLGCKVIRSENLPKISTTRSCYLFTKSSVGLAIAKDVTSRIDELPTNHYAKQIYFSMTLGASRLQEAGVVQIGCKE